METKKIDSKILERVSNDIDCSVDYLEKILAGKITAPPEFMDKILNIGGITLNDEAKKIDITVNADSVGTIYSECDKKSEIESLKEVIRAQGDEISALKAEIDLIKNKE